MRTFKEHKINGKIIEQSIHEAIISNTSPGSKSYRNIVNNYIVSLNQKPNRKSFYKSPERHDIDVTAASLLMHEPLHSRAFSERYGEDNRRNEISKFKSENLKVVSLLEEIASKRAEIVDRTPFDNFEGNNIALELVDQRLTELYELLSSNQHIVRKTVERAIEPVNENVDELREQFSEEMEVLNKKIDMLLPKPKKKAAS